MIVEHDLLPVEGTTILRPLVIGPTFPVLVTPRAVMMTLPLLALAFDGKTGWPSEN